ncbi:hypothetical protein EUX98_g2752 [Antrodiella citrinella]|uniref:NAD-dependent epimerase/dehydratase domain-containing protein n=1 Tax=Antrodiella citrinella TaxID=2447956 RepID=A0A4S4N6H9_9APHY|nr:hypothetical protein EUX98_g2752 [Antrodiella citrinella]
MPAITSGKVLVTGINGFTAMWFARALLEAGYSVRGTVRSASKGEHPKKYFKSFGSKLEIVVVPDITKDGAFDEAVKGVDAIVHSAAAFQVTATDNQEYIRPAVEGTVGLLKSSLKYGTKVKRFVFLSSVSTIHDQYGETRTVYTEKDWNDRVVDKSNSKDAVGTDHYEASKVLSERAAWEFMEKNKHALKFDLVTLHPGLILGEGLQEVEDPKDLNLSLQVFYFSVCAGLFKGDDLLKRSVSWVSVHDLTDALLAALRTEKAGGERFLITNEQFCWQDWINVVKTFDPTVDEGVTTWKRDDANFNISFDTSKAGQVLDQTYVSWKTCAKEELVENQCGDVNINDSDGDTPLYVVENVETARWLVEHGAVINRQNDEGISPAAALSEDFPEVAQYLENVIPSGVAPSTDTALHANPSQHAQNQVTESLTTSLLDSVQDIMNRAEAEGRDPDEELRQVVGRTVLSGMATGYEMSRDPEGDRDRGTDDANDAKRTKTNGNN